MPLTTSTYIGNISDVIFLAESEQDYFTNIEIITASAYKKEQAMIQSVHIGGSIKNMKQRARLLENSLPTVEFIEVFADYIRICLDVKRVDDCVIDRVIKILMGINNFNPGQRIPINEIKTINS